MLGIKELLRRRLQFALITVIVALIAYLILMINALGLGLQSFAGSALNNLDVDYLAYADGSNLSIPRSELPDEIVQSVASAPGVSAAGPMGYFTITPSKGDKQFPAALLGIEPGAPGSPEVVEGRLLAAGSRELVADRSYLRAAGFAIGDTITIPARLQNYDFTIVGASDSGRFFFQSPVYIDIAAWQELRYGGATLTGPDGQQQASPAASVVLVRGGPPEGIEAAVEGVRVVDKSTAFNNIEGVQAQNQTVVSLRSLGYIIGGLVIGIFFYVLTLQKIGQIGILKAIGAGGWPIFIQLAVQVVAIVLVSCLVAVPLVLLTLRGIESALPDFPLLLTTATIVTTVIVLLVVSLIGALVSGRQIASVDPIIALGQTNT